MSYPLNIKDCAKGPSQGGLPVGELRKVASEMGINTKGLKKAQICSEIQKKLAPAAIKALDASRVRAETAYKAAAQAIEKSNSKKDEKMPEADIKALLKEMELDETDFERGVMLHRLENFNAYGDTFTRFFKMPESGDTESAEMQYMLEAAKGLNESNKQRIQKMSKEDLEFIIALKNRIKDGKVKIMDLEEMQALPGELLTMDLDGNILIMAPR